MSLLTLRSVSLPGSQRYITDFHFFTSLLRASYRPGFLYSSKHLQRLVPKWLLRTGIQAWFLDVVWAALLFASAERGRSCSSIFLPPSGHVFLPVELCHSEQWKGCTVLSWSHQLLHGRLGCWTQCSTCFPEYHFFLFAQSQSCLQLPRKGLQEITIQVVAPSQAGMFCGWS